MRRQAVEVVCCKQNRAPLAVQIAQQMQNLMPRAHVDTASGFVQNQNVGLAEHRPRDEHALLLASAELANVPTFQTMQPQPIEHIGHLGTLARRCARPAPACAGHSQHLTDRDRKIPIDRFHLGHVADPSTARYLD